MCRAKLGAFYIFLRGYACLGDTAAFIASLNYRCRFRGEWISFQDEYLNGLALVDDSLTKGKTIRYMNIEDMPDDEYKRCLFVHLPYTSRLLDHCQL